MATGVDLVVNSLTVAFKIGGIWTDVITDVSLDVKRGRTLGLVGESGSGKTVTALSIVGLLPKSRVQVEQATLRERELMSASNKKRDRMRGNRFTMIYQEPMTSLNPTLTVGHQVAEGARRHMGMNRKEALEASVEVLRRVGIPEPESRIASYPHEFSGGMRQRVVIAMAIITNPWLLVADEPTTALDTTIQASILELLVGLCDSSDMSMLFISHNLGVIRNVAHDVAVMYAGEIVEVGPVDKVFSNPKHPYTEGLLRSSPTLTSPDILPVIPGNVPSPGHWLEGCRFRDRCQYAIDDCAVPEIGKTLNMRGPSDHVTRCKRVNDLDLRGAHP